MLKFLCILFGVLLLCSTVCKAQITCIKGSSHRFDETKEDVFPLKFNLDIGSSLPFNKNNNIINFGLIAGLGVNFSKNTFFLKAETGYLAFSNTSELENAAFISAGLDVKMLKQKRSSIYAGFYATFIKNAFPSLTGSVRYVFAFNESVGISTSVRIPFASYNPFLSIGLYLNTY